VQSVVIKRRERAVVERSPNQKISPKINTNKPQKGPCATGAPSWRLSSGPLWRSPGCEEGEDGHGDLNNDSQACWRAKKTKRNTQEYKTKDGGGTSL
jgi:hypothetical protein